MSNTLTAVAPRILAQGLVALRQNAVFARLVNSDYKVDAAQKGQTVDIPIPSAIAAQDVTPANVPPSTADVAPTFAKITLDQWKEAPFYLTDSELKQVMNGFQPMQATEAIKSVANAVDQYIAALYKGVYGYTGTSGTTPFTATGQTQPTEVTNARAILNTQLAPIDSRRFVLDPNAEAAALNLRAFQSAAESGNTDAVVRGALGMRLGFDFFMNQNTPTHTSTPFTAGAATVNGVTAVGATTISIAKATNTSPLVVGDILTFAGDSQTYVVTTAVTLAVGNTNVTISPGKKIATVGAEAVTLKASHVVNLAFHRDAIGFATRTLDDTIGLTNEGGMLATQDPISGINIRLEIRREHKRTRWSFDVLYGATLVRPELACRLAG